MFYIISKALFFLIQPLNWILGLMIYGLFTKKAKRKQYSWTAALVLFLFLGNHFCFNLIVRWWEPETLQFDEIKEPYDIGILLGGYSNFHLLPKDGRYALNERGNRFTQAVDLYFQGKIKKILLTGGSGSLLESMPGEAGAVLDYLLRMGIPREDLIIENQSRNTYENALFTARLLKQQAADSRNLLITSAWHMPRSIACFKKQNISFTPLAVDHMSESIRFIPRSILFPNVYNFYRWELVIKEWVGYVVYRLAGYV